MTSRRTLARACAALFCCAILLLAAPRQASAQDSILVFAPSSMTDIVAKLGELHEAETGVKIVASVASTAQLARQLEAGAPADIFISADKEWMDFAEDRNLVAEGSVSEFARNTLVIAVRNEVENWADPKGLVTIDRFAMGEPEAIPAGRYAEAALRHLGLWEKAKKNAVFGENVRIALRRLALGEVSAALVYTTDVAIEPAVRAIYTFPIESHPPIGYRVAVVKGAKRAAPGFVEFLMDETAQAALREAGFSPPPSQ